MEANGPGGGGDKPALSSVRGSYSRSNKCRADGKVGTIYVDNIPLMSTVKVISAPLGQALPPTYTVTSTSDRWIYPYGTDLLLEGTYVMEINNKCGDPPVRVSAVIPALNLQYSTEMYASPCVIGLAHGAITGDMPARSTIKLITGGTGDPASVVHTNITLPSDLHRFDPFSIDYGSSQYGYNAIAPGTYTFEIWNSACNITKTVTINVAVFDIKDFTYTQEQTCTGMKITPSGTVQYRGQDYVYPNPPYPPLTAYKISSRQDLI